MSSGSLPKKQKKQKKFRIKKNRDFKVSSSSREGKARFQSAMINCFFGFLVADLGSKGSCKELAKWVRSQVG
jgi:hypothetical protein